LVLSRKRSERIVVRFGSEAISICVVEIYGDKVRLGVEAPKHVEVNREEVDRAIIREGRHGHS
jgi:carbon storage regulator